MSSVGVSRAQRLPGRLWIFALGPSWASPAHQCLPGPPAKSDLASEKISIRWHFYAYILYVKTDRWWVVFFCLIHWCYILLDVNNPKPKVLIGTKERILQWRKDIKPSSACDSWCYRVSDSWSLGAGKGRYSAVPVTSKMTWLHDNAKVFYV